jgi:hypothetical protein
MKTHQIILVSLFSLFSCSSTKELPAVAVFDDFADNTNGWVDSANKSTVLIQKISDGKLCLDSFNEEMGVASSMTLALDEAKDFSIEASMKIKGKNGLAYASIDFGILKLTNGMRTISGVDVPTDLGDSKYYFGFSSERELLVTEWNKGKEVYFYRGYSDKIDIKGFNKIFIEKRGDSISYAINDKVVFKQKAKKLKGEGLGFSVAPNATLWVDYLKVIN